MKNWTWQQWTALGIIAAVIIAAVVLHLVQPEVSFAFFEIGALVMFAVGVVAGYLLKKKNIVNEEPAKQLLKD